MTHAGRCGTAAQYSIGAWLGAYLGELVSPARRIICHVAVSSNASVKKSCHRFRHGHWREIPLGMAAHLKLWPNNSANATNRPIDRLIDSKSTII